MKKKYYLGFCPECGIEDILIRNYRETREFLNYHSGTLNENENGSVVTLVSIKNEKAKKS